MLYCLKITGSFIYLKEDGTAEQYSIRSRNLTLDPSKETSILADLIEPHEFKTEIMLNHNFVTAFRYPENNSHDRNSLNGMMDHFDWSELHYACRFRADDEAVILEILQDKTIHNKFAADKFGRYPIHLACQGSAPVNVIKLLLQHEEVRASICLGTTRFRRIPLHIACYKKLSADAIEALLQYDEQYESIVSQTFGDRQSLHIAIEQKASKDVLKVLLDADKRRIKQIEERRCGDYNEEDMRSYLRSSQRRSSIEVSTYFVIIIKTLTICYFII